MAHLTRESSAANAMLAVSMAAVKVCKNLPFFKDIAYVNFTQKIYNTSPDYHLTGTVS